MVEAVVVVPPFENREGRGAQPRTVGRRAKKFIEIRKECIGPSRDKGRLAQDDKFERVLGRNRG
jgi:hypothetical protein